jgi:hypothetical protein
MKLEPITTVLLSLCCSGVKMYPPNPEFNTNHHQQFTLQKTTPLKQWSHLQALLHESWALGKQVATCLPRALRKLVVSCLLRVGNSWLLDCRELRALGQLVATCSPRGLGSR